MPLLSVTHQSFLTGTQISSIVSAILQLRILPDNLGLLQTSLISLAFLYLYGGIALMVRVSSYTMKGFVTCIDFLLLQKIRQVMVYSSSIWTMLDQKDLFSHLD